MATRGLAQAGRGLLANGNLDLSAYCLYNLPRSVASVVFVLFNSVYDDCK